MKIVVDCREYAHHPLELEIKAGAAWVLKEIASTCRQLGHQVHAVLAGHVEMEQDGISYWPEARHPQVCDAYIAPSKRYEGEFQAGKAYTGHALLDFWPPLAVAPREKVPGKMVWMAGANRGLWHVVEMWPAIKERVPNASIVVGHNLQGYIDTFAWQHDFQGIFALDLREWMARDDVTVLRNEERDTIQRHTAEAQLFAYPADPIMHHKEHRSLSAYEAAKAGCALLFAPSERLGEDFDGVAGFLESPWAHDDWIETIGTWLTTHQELSKWQQSASEWAASRTPREFSDGWAKRLEE